MLGTARQRESSGRGVHGLCLSILFCFYRHLRPKESGHGRCYDIAGRGQPSVAGVAWLVYFFCFAIELLRLAQQGGLRIV